MRGISDLLGKIALSCAIFRAEDYPAEEKMKVEERRLYTQSLSLLPHSTFDILSIATFFEPALPALEGYIYLPFFLSFLLSFITNFLSRVPKS